VPCGFADERLAEDDEEEVGRADAEVVAVR
jgi:hypothetical protein